MLEGSGKARGVVRTTGQGCVNAPSTVSTCYTSDMLSQVQCLMTCFFWAPLPVQDAMVVSATGLGACRKSCGACQVCSDGDQACYDNNRRNVSSSGGAQSYRLSVINVQFLVVGSCVGRCCRCFRRPAAADIWGRRGSSLFSSLL